MSKFTITKSRSCSIHSIRPGTMFTWRWNKTGEYKLAGDRGLYICTQRATGNKMRALALDRPRGRQSNFNADYADYDEISFRVVLDLETA